MPHMPTVPYRSLLLASVAAVAISVHASAQTISNSVTGPVAVGAGTPLVVTGTGTIATTSNNTDAVTVGVASPSLSNSGLIQASGSYSYGVHVTSGGNLTALTNAGTIAQAGFGSALQVDSGGTIGTLTNSGAIGGSSNNFVGISVASGGTIGSIVNSAGGQILSGGPGGYGVKVNGALGTLTNAAGATIAVSGYSSYGVYLSGSATAMTNAGLIQANGSNSNAILVSSSATVGTVSNSGTIQADGRNGIGVNLAFGSIGTLTNTGLIQANGSNGLGVAISVGASIGTLTNNGTILANGYRGVGIDIRVGTITALTNTGLIQANGSYGSGIGLGLGNFKSLRGQGNTVGALTNSGTIQANGYGGYGINLRNGTIAVLTNTGLIQANGSYGVGIALGALQGSTLGHAYGAIGTLSNSGTIQANASRSTGVYVRIGTIAQLTNSGLIQNTGANGWGVKVGGYASIGTLTNNGTIAATGPNGVGITLQYNYFGAGVTRIVNNAGGTIAGTKYAIANYSSNLVSIVNAGQILGNIRFGLGADSLTITGQGTVAGRIVGRAGRGQSVVLNPSVPFVLNNVISNVDSISASGGTVIIQQLNAPNYTNLVTTSLTQVTVGPTQPAISGAVPIANAQSFNIAAGATVQFNSGTIQARNFVNQGLLDVGTGTPTIDTTNLIRTSLPAGPAVNTIATQFSQTATGQFGVGINSPTTNGKLTVVGAATVGGSVIVATPTAAAQSVLLANQTFTVLTATSLTSTISGTTAASATTAPAVLFTVGQNANNLTLTARLNPVSNLLPNTGLYNVTQVEFGLAGLASQLAAANDLTDYAKLIAPFSGGILTIQQQTAILTRLQGFLVGGNLVALGSVLWLEGAPTQTLLNHQTASRQTDGLAAGDEVGRGYQVWVQPFGSFRTQNATTGLFPMDASSANTYGLVAGADTLLRPDLRVGLALTLGNTDIAWSGNLSGNKASDLATQATAYGTWYQGHWFVDGAASAGFDWYSTHEIQAAFGGNRDASFSGTHLSARVGTGYDWLVNSQLTVTPYASVQDVHYNVNGYSTHGLGLLDVTVSNKAFDTVQSRIGAKVAYAFNQGAYTLTPELHTYYQHNFSPNLTTTESFVGGGPSFTTIVPARDRDLWNVGFGLTVAKIGRVTLTGLYDYLGGATSSDHQFSMRFTTDF